MNTDTIQHHGIFGMHWGIRRYQNPDGSLTPAGQKHRAELDQKWVKKNYDKIYNSAYKTFSNELKKNKIREVTKKNEKKLPRSYINAYNKEMAKIMNLAVGDLAAPSGQVVRFIAKRGEVGVHMALADAGYDLAKEFKNGVWSGGRVAYKKKSVERMNI